MEFRDDAADRRMAETPSLAAYLPRILLYPLSGHALPALLLLAVILWFGLQSVLGVPALAIGAPWVFHYAQGVIEKTAAGGATPPQFGGNMIYLTSWEAFRPLIGVALVATGLWVVRDAGPRPIVAVLAAGALLFPAFMLVLTIENSVLAALNPLKLVQAMVGVGGAYFAVSAILAAAAAATVYTVGQGQLFMSLLVSIYLWLMSFHLLGYVTYHRADRLGWTVLKAAPTDASRAMDEQAQRLAATIAAIDAALAARNLEAAGKALYGSVGGPADPRLFQEELFEAMEARRRPELVHAQGARLITQLLREKRTGRALEIVTSCFDAHRDFSPERPEQAVTLAEAALGARNEGLFERLTHDAGVRYGAHPAAVSLQFLRAKYFCELKRDDTRAREALKPLLAQSSHPQHRQIVAYARALAAGA